MKLLSLYATCKLFTYITYEMLRVLLIIYVLCMGFLYILYTVMLLPQKTQPPCFILLRLSATLPYG